MTRKEQLQELHSKIGGEEVAKKLGKILSHLRNLTSENLQELLADQTKKGQYENCGLIQIILEERK